VDNPGKVLSGDPEEQKRYNEIVIQQLTEIWSNYGKLLEIWFDGGVLPPEQGGPDIPALLWKLQPQAVVFQGPKGTPSLLRWVGNERGEAPYPCWSTTNMKTGNITGGAECPEAGAGDPGGAIWAPAESDMPNRNHRWFWVEGEDHLLYSVNELVERYYLSVGRNTNLLLGMVIDDRGLVPDADVKQFTEFGAEVRRRFSRNLAEVSGEGDEVILNLGQPTMVDSVITMEDIDKGERVREYVIDGLVDGEWTEICKGISIGHKRINCFEPVEVSKVKLRCTKSVAMPIIRRLAVYLFPQNTQS
jgi:alpha-L-fucosidase